MLKIETPFTAGAHRGQFGTDPVTTIVTIAGGIIIGGVALAGVKKVERKTTKWLNKKKS